MLEPKKSLPESSLVHTRSNNRRQTTARTRRKSTQVKQQHNTSLISSLKCEILSIKFMEIVRAATKTQMDIIYAYALGREKYYTDEHVATCLMNQVKWEVQKTKVLAEMERERNNHWKNLRKYTATKPIVPETKMKPEPPKEDAPRSASKISDRRLTIVANCFKSVRAAGDFAKGSSLRTT